MRKLQPGTGPRMATWRESAQRGWRWAAALAVVLAVPLAVAAQPGLAQAAQGARAVPIAAGLPSYGTGGVPPVSVGYTAQYPQSVAVDPVTGTVFTANPVNDTVQVISESSETVAESISVASAPIALAVDPVSGTVYVGENGQEVQVITENPSNPGQDAVTATVSVPANEEGFCAPDGIGVLPGTTAGTGTVYVANQCGNTVSVISEAANTVTNTIQIPGLPANSSSQISADPVGVAVDGSGNVFVADSGDGYITVINGASYLGSFPLSSNPSAIIGMLGIAADPATGAIYVTAPLVGPSPYQGELFVIQENAANPAASTVAATIPVPAAGTSGATSGVPEAVAVNPNTATVYVTNEEGAVEAMTEDTANPANDAFSYAIDIGGGNGVPADYGAAADTSTGNPWSGDLYVASDQSDDLYPILAQSVSFTAPTCPSPGCEAGQTSTLTATGGASGNPVTFSVDPSSGAGVCSVSGTNGTTLNYLAPGTCVVDANQANSNFYLAAPQASASITVLPAKKQTIKWTVAQQPSTSYWGPDSGYYGATVTLKATATSGLPVAFTVDSTSQPGVCSVSGTNGTTLTYNTLGDCVIDANQAGNNTYLSAPQVQASITVDPAVQTITFKPPATELVGKTVTLTATGGGSGNPVIFTLDPTSQPGVCSLSGQYNATVTFNAPGGCVIDAYQQGSTSPPYDYMPAQQVSALIVAGIAPTFVQASPPLSVAPGAAYNYTFVASGIDTPTYALSANAPSWLSINPTTGQVSGTVPNTSPPLAYTYSVTATNHFGTATTSRFVVLPAPSSATTQVSADLSCSGNSCTLGVTNQGPAATQVVVSVVMSPQLYLFSPNGQLCPDNYGCFQEANTLTWSLGSMAANSSTGFSFGLGQAGTCTGSGCTPIAAIAGTPSQDNLDTGYSTYAAANQAVSAGPGPSDQWARTHLTHQAAAPARQPKAGAHR